MMSAVYKNDLARQGTRAAAAGRADCVYNSVNNNRRGIPVMRSLSVYGLIGALFGVSVFLLLAAIAMPAYHEYLMPLAMYRDITAIAPFAGVLDKLSAGLPWAMVVLFVWVWFIVAGRLNPALARWPMAPDVNRLWAVASWIGGGLLLLAAFLIGSAIPTTDIFGFGKRAGILEWIVAFSVMAMVWMLISPQAFGRFGGQPPARLSGAAVARAAGLGALFALVFGLIVKVAGAAFSAWFMVVTEALDRSMEPSLFGWTWLAIGMIGMLALAGAVAFGLLPAFVPGAGSWRERMVATRPALILAAGALVVGALSLPVLSRIDYFGSSMLVNAADLSGIRPLSFRLVKFCADKNCRDSKDRSANPALITGEPITKVSGIGSSLRDGGYVPLHPDTVPALEKFVAGKGANSMLRKAAMMSAAEVHKTLWLPRESFALVERFTRQGSIKHGSLIYTQIQLAWLLRAAPITPETRAMLEALSDDRRYFIGNRAAARLAAAWARFGDMKQAEALLAQARKASPGKYDFVRLVPGGSIGGQVSGQVILAGAGSDGIRVGLFRLTDDPTRQPAKPDKPKKPSAKGPEPAFNSTGISLLADSAVLKADGRFAFRNLGAGDYYLAVLVPDEKLRGKSALAGVNVPDVIRLGAAAPRRDLGAIRLVAK
jgi:hypothetical protein